jgi:hypothetical protein
MLSIAGEVAQQRMELYTHYWVQVRRGPICELLTKQRSTGRDPDESPTFHMCEVRIMGGWLDGAAQRECDIKKARERYNITPLPNRTNNTACCPPSGINIGSGDTGDSGDDITISLDGLCRVC